MLEVSILRKRFAPGRWRVSAAHPRATEDYSKQDRPRTAPSEGLGTPARAAAGLALAGIVVTIVAAFTNVIEITVLTVPQEQYTGLDRSGPALLLLAGLALLMLAGAWRGARPAMAAVSLVGIGVLLVVLLIDAPDVNDAGAWPRADLYEEATARAGVGFWFESAGGVLLLLSGGLMLLLAPRGRQPRPERSERPRGDAPTREERRAAREERRAPARPVEDWMAPDPPAAAAPPPPPPPGPPPARRRQGGVVGRLRGRDR